MTGTITDPETIARLDAMRLGTATEDVPRSSALFTAGGSPRTVEDINGLPSSGIVRDPTQIARLDSMRQAVIDQSNALEAVSTVEPEQWVAPDPTFLQRVGGSLETAATIVSSLAAEPISGFAGLVVGATDRDLNSAINTIESVRSSLTYTPKTVSGNQQLEALGGALAPIGEAIVGASESLGDFGYRTTGSPEVAAAMYSLPTLVMELGGLKAARVAGKATPATTRIRGHQRTLLNDEYMGRYSGDVAEVTLNRAGDVVPDALGERLVAVGVPRNTTALVTNASPASKQGMLRMLDTFEGGQVNDIAEATAKMSNEIGASVTKRLAALQGRRAYLGTKLDDVVRNNLQGTTVSIEAPIGEFLSDLVDTFDLTVKPDGTLSGLDKGIIAARSMTTPRNLIIDTLNVLKQKTNNGMIDAAAAHKLKKGLDELADASKAAEAGLSNTTHGRLLALRTGVNDALIASSDDYASINAKLSAVIETMKPFSDYRPRGSAWNDPNVAGVVGAAVKDMWKDTPAATELRQSVAKLDPTLSGLGIKFKDDVQALVAFRKGVNDYFNINLDELATRNKRLGTATTQKIMGAGASLALGNSFGAAHDATALIALGMRKKEAARLVNDMIKSKKLIKSALNNQRAMPLMRDTTRLERVGLIGGGSAASMSDNEEARPPLQSAQNQ